MDDLDLTGVTSMTVKPGDRVVLVIRDASMGPERLDQLKVGLNERLPDVEWTIVAGVDAVIHQPA